MTLFHLVIVPPPKPLIGSKITSTQGALTARISKTLSGQAITSSQGTVSFSKSGLSLLGRAITSRQGAVVSAGSLTRALTGQSITSTRGAITASRQLMGLAITSAQGNITPGQALTRALTGKTISTAGSGSPVTLNITTTTMTDAVVGQAYSYTFSVVGYSSLNNLLWSLDAAG